MGICLGSHKIKLNFGGANCLLNIFSPTSSPSAPPTPTVNGVMLLSSDGYVLKDLNDVYLTAKESE